MKQIERSTEPRQSTPTPVAAGKREPCKAGYVYRLDRCLAFGLGGILLSAAGYAVGAFLPCPPVDVVCLRIVSGGFGLVIGALPNIRGEPPPAPPPPRAGGPQQPSSEEPYPAPAVSEVHLWGMGRLGGEPGPGMHILVLRSFPCILGRHPECDYPLGCPFISRRHCVLSLRDGRAWVQDLHSHHGTRLNGEALDDEPPLANGDRLEIGPVPVRVYLVRKPVDLGDHGSAGNQDFLALFDSTIERRDRCDLRPGVAGGRPVFRSGRGVRPGGRARHGVIRG